MLKRWMLLLVTGMLLVTVTGCGNKNQEPTEVIVESAVDNTTADSDNIQVEVETDIEELPPLEEAAPAENQTKAEEVKEEEFVYEPAEISCSMPSGFVADSEEPGLYLHKSYPKDVSSISYVISESGEDVSQLKLEDYRTALEADFLESYGDEVKVSVTQYDKITVDKRPGLKIKLHYEFKGVVYEQLIYMIYNGTESHILSYTQEKDGKWMEKFEESGDSIRLVPVN